MSDLESVSKSLCFATVALGKTGSETAISIGKTFCYLSLETSTEVRLYSSPRWRGVWDCPVEIRPYSHRIQGITAMPKQKTHKGIKKRFTVTASGKAKCRSPYRGHLQSHKPAKRKRQNRVDTILIKADAAMICDALRSAGR